MEKIGAVIMAGGYGRRMNAGYPKVLRELAGRPMIAYTLNTLTTLGIKTIVVVVGYMAETVKAVLGSNVLYAKQTEPLGTAHAMQEALRAMPISIDTILSVYGDDSAFYKPETLQCYITFFMGNQADVACLTSVRDDPAGLGRILRGDAGRIIEIVEEKVATETEKKIKEINTGAYLFRREVLEKLLPKVERNTTGEYFLTDVIGLASRSGFRVEAFPLADSEEWFGVNTPEQLAIADSKMRERIAKR